MSTKDVIKEDWKDAHTVIEGQNKSLDNKLYLFNDAVDGQSISNRTDTTMV